MRFLTAFLLSSLIMPAVAAQDADSSPSPQAIDEVLVLADLPLSVDLLTDNAKADEISRALVMQLDQGRMPAEDRPVSLFGQSLRWQRQALPSAGGEGLSLWTVNLEVDRWVEGALEIEALDDPALFHNGQSVKLSDGKAELTLAAGTHRFWLLHRGPVDGETPSWQWQGKSGQDSVSMHLEPDRRVSPELLTNAETVNWMAISPNGQRLALRSGGRIDSADLAWQRLDIRDLETGYVVRSWTSDPPSALAWSPDSQTLAVQEGDNLWLHPDNGEPRLLLANHEKLGSWEWHPDGRSLIFAWTESEEDPSDKRRRVRSLEDRWANFRDNQQLYQVDVASGLIRPLTGGDSSVTLHDIHPAGERLLLTQRLIDYAEPPHSLVRLFELNLNDLEEREIGQFRVLNGALFSSDGYWLLSGPGLPGADGATTGESLTPNEYDGQLYALSADGESARSLSRDFDPALNSLHRLPDGDLLLSATAGERSILVRFDARRERFSEVATGVEVMEQFVASKGRRAQVVVRGTDADAPQRVHHIDLARGDSEVLIDSRDGPYADVRFGEVRPWQFSNTDGVTIDGRYYLPPDFDPEQTYPLIVYYYGGTLPVNRQFTGRYPFNLWAARGYVIYVLQPRGTVGYGQEFSALHVNAWGRYTADDIIEGTDKFLAAHDFVDPERVGNIGASYGGFMTMYLATLTDKFAASISHAGISTLTSYWGEGWWGYGYSGIASRGSFPWNNRELYVDQSPIYSADKITTPLLLLTGDSDTNVPPGESDAMFTALKLLGREVELVEFPGEDHWILDREKRYVWWDTMLAWFDRYLKDQPEWWNHLYPES